MLGWTGVYLTSKTASGWLSGKSDTAPGLNRPGSASHGSRHLARGAIKDSRDSAASPACKSATAGGCTPSISC